MGSLHWKPPLLLSIVICFTYGAWAKEGAPYYGRLIGSFVSQYHDISGDVYAVDARTLFIKNFNYDGRAKDAVFFGGTSPKPGPDGFVIPVESGGSDGLSRAYASEDLTLTLPEGRTLKDLRWLAIWSRPYSAVLSEVKIPVGFEYPRPQRLGTLSGEHKVSSDRIYIVDAQTFLVPNFTYDGGAPDAFFWVGKGVKPSRDGVKVPDENGGVEPLRSYDTKSLVLTLPGDLTVFDIDWMGIWCQEFYVDFGHVRIPKNLNVPPSLKMLGIAPQAKLNCEVLWDELALEVRWAVAGETIVLQLVGKLDDKQYVSFGPSGDLKRSRMTGGDVAIGWLDRSTGKGFVQDYFMSYKSQCSGERGVCADSNLPGGSNNVRLLNAALVNDYVMLTYQRPLKAYDEHDRPIITNGTQAVIWSIGPLNSKNEPSYHVLHNRGDLLLDFGRTPQWNCPAPEELPSAASKPTELVPYEDSDHLLQHPKAPIPAPPAKSIRPWYIPAIECYEPENRVFYAHIGPNGGQQGYNSITKHVGWGISWYINGLLIPEVTVVRGQTYTFVVEGGQDTERPARYHPFYITDDPEGGYEYKTPVERSRVRVFAGIGSDREGKPNPTAAGRLCEWMEDPAHPADSFTSFGAYQRTLKLNCEEGQPAILQWTPDEDTPDTVYYQCYTHRYLGWKIRVIDSCDMGKTRKSLDTSASETHSADSYNPTGEAQKEGINLREGHDYEQEYYDEEYVNKDRPNPAVRQDEGDFTKDQGFFPPSGFPKFPSGFDDLLKEQESPFQKEELPFNQRPQVSNTFGRDPQSNEAQIQKNRVPQNPKEGLRQNQQPVTENQPSYSANENADRFPTLFKDQANQNRLPPVSLPGPQFDGRPPQQQQNRIPEVSKRPSPEQRRPPPQLPRLPQTSNPRQPFQNNVSPPQSPALPARPPVAKVPVRQPSPSDYSSSIDSLRLPLAENKGFNPQTIIWETGFKPMKSSSGPVPPLGFEVEAGASEKQVALSNHAPYYTDTNTPSLVTLDPVFVPSEPEAFNISALQNHLAVPLPVPIVPVVPGPPTFKQQPLPPRQGPQQRPKQPFPQQPSFDRNQPPQQPPFDRKQPPQRLPRPPAPSLEAQQESGIKIPGLSLLKFMNSQRRKQQSQPQGPVQSSPGRQPQAGYQQQPQGTQFNIRQQQLHTQQKTETVRLPAGQNRPQQKQGSVEPIPNRQGPQGRPQFIPNRPGNPQARPTLAQGFADRDTAQQGQHLNHEQKQERPIPNALHSETNQVHSVLPPRKPQETPGRAPPQNIQKQQVSRPGPQVEPQRPRQPPFPAANSPLKTTGAVGEKQRPNKQPSFFSLEGISRFMGLDRRTQKVTDKSQEVDVGAPGPHRGPQRPRYPARPASPQEPPNRKKVGNFQGPLPQLPPRPNSGPQSRIQQGTQQGPPRPIKPAVPLDPISASIINGGSIMGMAPGAVKQTISAEEKAHLEKMLFGPSGNSLKRMGEYENDKDETEADDAVDDTYDELDSSESLHESPRVSSIEQDGLVFAESPSVGFKASRAVGNSTDLTILTDVWSNIKTESEKQTEEHSEVPESEEFRLVDRMERKLSRKKRSPAADDADEDQNNIGSGIDQRMLDEVSKLQMEHRGLDEEALIESQDNSTASFNYASFITVLLPSLISLLFS